MLIPSTMGISMLTNIIDIEKHGFDREQHIASELAFLESLVVEANARIQTLRCEQPTVRPHNVTSAMVAKAPPALHEQTDNPYVLSGASATIVAALHCAGDSGLVDGEINRAVWDSGFSVAVAEEMKTRLKNAGIIVRSELGGWRITNAMNRAINILCKNGNQDA
jgi:hypothetical protein